MLLQPGSRPVPKSPDYELIRKLGAGTFGEVWHALGPGGLDVALKFIRLDSHVRDVELRSLDVMKTIRHPNLVSLFGAWHKHSWLILAMELCDRSLQDRLIEALDQDLPGIPLRELLSYMTDAANGLDALNASQVQHRDVKPANILLLASGVKVGDFGLAKALEQTVASNSGAGTIAYIAPECFKGQLTQQSDQYSLAVTYYHLRTGHLLFKGDQAQVMYAHLELEPDLSRSPSAERGVLARALSKEPERRWPNCKAFVKSLVDAYEQLSEEKLRRREAEQRRRQHGRYRRERKAAAQEVKEDAGKKCEKDAKQKAKPRLSADERLQALLDSGKELDFLTYCQVSEYLGARVFRIEPDGCLRIVPDDAANQARLAKLLSVLSEHDIELIDGTEAGRLDPDDPLAHYHSGNAWFEKEEYEKAIGAYKEASHLDLKDALVWIEKKRNDTAIKEIDNAIRNFEKAARLDLNTIGEDRLRFPVRPSDSAPLHYNRGMIWLVQKEYSKAISDFDGALRLDPEDPFTCHTIAWLLATCPDEKIRNGRRDQNSNEGV